MVFFLGRENTGKDMGVWGTEFIGGTALRIKQ
jgi:hypothetical protein